MDLTERTLGVKRVFEGRALTIDVAEIDAALDSGELIDGKSIALWLMWRRQAQS